MAEIWDAYDKHFQIIANAELLRGAPIPDGMYHLVGDIIVKHTDGTYLLMQRDPQKHYGGLWELSAGGAALKGENPLSCAKRELREETGIASGSWEEIERIVWEANHTLYVVFLCRTDCDKQSVTLQAGETVAYRWVDRDTLLGMGADELASLRAVEMLRAKHL